MAKSFTINPDVVEMVEKLRKMAAKRYRKEVDRVTASEMWEMCGWYVYRVVVEEESVDLDDVCRPESD